jgi:hypothetical protein
LIADERPSRLHHRFLPCQVLALLHRLRRPTLQNNKQSATKGIRSCRAVVEKEFVQTAGAAFASDLSDATASSNEADAARRALV